MSADLQSISAMSADIISGLFAATLCSAGALTYPGCHPYHPSDMVWTVELESAGGALKSRLIAGSAQVFDTDLFI